MTGTYTLFFTFLLFGLGSAQQIGTNTQEQHPKLPILRCSVKEGCLKQDTAVVLDAFSRDIHKIGQSNVSCGNSGYLNPEVCPDAASCAKNCVLEGIDYTSHGLKTEGDALILNQFLKGSDGTYTVVSPRAYLLDSDGKNYESFKLLSMEMSFDVDVSKLVCGMNGALYLAEMEATGGRSAENPAGAEYGTGYCDAQCPKLAWINGVVCSRVSLSDWDCETD
jgi:cellulase